MNVATLNANSNALTDPMPEALVVVEDARSVDDSPSSIIDVDRWERLAEASLRTEQAAGELTLTFIDRDEIAALNAEYMEKTGPTDVLSFPLDDDPMPGSDVPVLLGDIVVSPAVAAGQCEEHAGTFDDEIALLVVHGVLHILGHDHQETEERAVMQERELALLTEHHWGGPAPVGFRQDHRDDQSGDDQGAAAE
jgi:probable rRNA maturation factor